MSDPGQPSQVYPPWLTLVTTTITDAFGDPVATDTSVAYLPLTYYGPSIPLGTEWTYGGLTSPASTPSTTPTSTHLSTTSPPPTTSATVIPTTSTAIPTSTTSATSPISSTSGSSSFTSLTSTSLSSSLFSSPASSPSSSPSATSSSSLTSPSAPTSSSSTAASAHSKRLPTTLIGAVVGTLGGVMLLTFLLLLCILRHRNRRRRANAGDWEVVHQDDDSIAPYPYPYPGAAAAGAGAAAGVAAGRVSGSRTSAEGSPNMAENETDPFLQRSSASGSGSGSGRTGSTSIRLVGTAHGLAHPADLPIAGGGAGVTTALLNRDHEHNDWGSNTSPILRQNSLPESATQNSGSWSSLFYNPNRTVGSLNRLGGPAGSEVSLTRTAHTTAGTSTVVQESTDLPEPPPLPTAVTLPALPAGAAPPAMRFIGGPILTREQLLRMNNEQATSPDALLYKPDRDQVLSPGQQDRVYANVAPLQESIILSPLSAPPTDPDRMGVVRRLASDEDEGSTLGGSDNASLEDARRAKLMTATRHYLLDPRSAPDDPSNPNILPQITFLGETARRLKRLSPFHRGEASAESSSTGTRQQDNDPRADHTLPPLGVPRPVDFPDNMIPELQRLGYLTPASAETNGLRPMVRGDRELGFLSGGERPVSGVSAKSAQSVGASTVYHSAVSTQNSRSTGNSSGSGGSGEPPVPPLPTGVPESAAMRVHGPSGLSMSVVGLETRSADVVPEPVPSDTLAPVREVSEGTQAPSPYDQVPDPLDVPAPTAVSRFSTASSRSSGPPYPPGLGLTPPSTWNGKSDAPAALAKELADPSAPSTSTAMGAPASIPGSTAQVLVSQTATHDLEPGLDDEPPVAGTQWQSLARLHEEELDSRRLTLGQPMVLNPAAIRSQNGSLQSYIHPASRSGSSHVHTSSGSHSRSGNGTSSSSASHPSLVHSNSIGSDGRWRPRRVTHSPPPASMSPSPRFQRASLTATGGGLPPPRLFTPSPPPRVYSPNDKIELSNEERLRAMHERAVQAAALYS